MVKLTAFSKMGTKIYHSPSFSIDKLCTIIWTSAPQLQDRSCNGLHLHSQSIYLPIPVRKWLSTVHYLWFSLILTATVKSDTRNLFHPSGSSQDIAQLVLSKTYTLLPTGKSTVTVVSWSWVGQNIVEIWRQYSEVSIRRVKNKFQSNL